MPDSLLLARVNARRHDAALAAARAAMERLCREGRAVNFGAVARAAGVSRGWLYRQADLRQEIGRLRSSGAFGPSRSTGEHRLVTPAPGGCQGRGQPPAGREQSAARPTCAPVGSLPGTANGLGE